jgi:hypothetical protein
MARSFPMPPDDPDQEELDDRRVKNPVPLSSIPRIELPPPSGHTESIPRMLRKARQDFPDPKGEGHKGLRAADVAALLERDFGVKAAEKKPGSRITEWERGRNEPDIRTYARWARVVGKRLDVQVLDADKDTVVIHVPAALGEAVATAQHVAESNPEKAKALLRIVSILRGLSVSEVRAIAFQLMEKYGTD